MAFDGVSEPLYSAPNFCDFSPWIIPYQGDVVEFLHNWDYSTGTPEILLSGSYGSAKSILMAHLVVKHLMANPGGRCCLARKAMPDLKDTIFKEILEHIEVDFEEGIDYWVNHTSAKITFANKSEIISRSWSDKKYKKGRSLKLSMLVFEELTENNEEDKQAFDTLKARLRRIPHIKENILIAATNPDSPAHWAYKYWWDEARHTRKVFKSVTTDNPFLDPIYIAQLKADLDPKSAQRYIYGEWIEIDTDRVYHAYQTEKNYCDFAYVVDPKLPTIITFDFNIGQGKPMSSCAMQFDGYAFHVFDEVITPGARTAQIAEEWVEKGIVKPGVKILIRGDASGSSNDTRSMVNDYDIIVKIFSNAGAIVEKQVPKANPPVRKRHNITNGYCVNELKQHRLFVYKTAKVAHDGMRLTALKKGGEYIEDDSKSYQHVTTAIGYSIMYHHNSIGLVQISSQKR